MTDATVDLQTPPSEAHDKHHAHPTDRKFVHTAILLTGITAVEVAWSYLPVWEDAHGMKSVVEIGFLMLFMMWKFIIVAGTFMHLKFDNRILTRIFYAGFAFAVTVYLVALTTFEIWGSGTPGFTP